MKSSYTQALHALGFQVGAQKAQILDINRSIINKTNQSGMEDRSISISLSLSLSLFCIYFYCN